ncbi:DUF6799 domain-containing protein [Hymenobacter sp. B81]|uniref:DUF6799 domain-containing protein n=1 Tax=Hymenobacter sp. B81 TaxID=3344878 RepID=UPI0037DC6ABC
MRLCLLLLLMMSLLAVPELSRAQSAPAYGIKDGAFRQNGTMMRLQGGQVSRLTAPLTLDDGSVINPNGLLVKKDGTRQHLPEGRAVNLQGVVVGLRDDMQAAQAIEQRDRQVTGATETRIVVPGRPGAAASAAQLRQLEQLEKRLALLLQLTDRLAARATQALGPAPTAYDEQLRALDAQLPR